MQTAKSGFGAGSVLVLLLCGLVPGAFGQDEDNGKVIAATVFITIIVILIIAGIIWCVLRRYQKIRQKRKPLATQACINPAFSEQNESSNAEEGVSQYVTAQETPDKIKTLSSYNGPNSLNKKDWNSLPKVQFAGTEYGSYGSLNSFVGSQDPDIVSVDLIGQDFTGLGFNISGNMKDGIYIDEIRNRGPARESEKLKAGDLIKDVSISFKNMVFKDALSILSYASPYPVKVTVQKQRQSLRQSLTSKGQVFHPIFRSHSVDDLNIIHKEPTPKISYNDLKGREKSPDKLQKSLTSTVFAPEDVKSPNADILEVIIHSETQCPDNNEKKIVPKEKHIENSQNSNLSLMSPLDRGIKGDKEDMSNIDEKMDLQFSKYDKEFFNLKHEAEEKTSQLELDNVHDNERKRSLNSENEFAELERSIRYSAHFSELYDKISDKSNIPRFNSEKQANDVPAVEDTISVTTTQNVMSQNPNISAQIPNKSVANGIPADKLPVGNSSINIDPFSFNSEDVFEDDPSLEMLDAKIKPTKKDFSLDFSTKSAPSFDGNFTDLNEIDMPLSKSSTDSFLTTPIKFVRKQDNLENSFSKYLADNNMIESDMKIPNHDEKPTLKLNSPDIPIRVDLTKDHDMTDLTTGDLQNNIDLQLIPDEFEIDENDSKVTKAKGLLSTDNDFKNKIWDRSYELENNVDTSFGLPMISNNDFNVESVIKEPTVSSSSFKVEDNSEDSIHNIKFLRTSGNNNDKSNHNVDVNNADGGLELSTNTDYMAHAAMTKSSFLNLDDSCSLLSETDDSYSPKLVPKRFQLSEESPYHSDNDSIDFNSPSKILNYDMEIKADTKITVNEATDSNISNFIEGDLKSNGKPYILDISTEPSNIDYNSPDSSQEEEEKPQGGFFSKTLKKVRSICDSGSPPQESSSKRKISDVSDDTSHETNLNLSDHKISHDIQVSTDSDEEHNKKDEAFFEMTEDEQSTDTQSLSPKSTLTNPISFKMASNNDTLLKTSPDVPNNEKAQLHLDGTELINAEDHQEDASSPEIVESSQFINDWPEINEDKLKTSADKHLKLNGENLSRPSFSDSNFSLSSDETKTISDKSEIHDVTPAKITPPSVTPSVTPSITPPSITPPSITISYNSSNHDSHTDSGWDHDSSSFDPF